LVALSVAAEAGAGDPVVLNAARVNAATVATAATEARRAKVFT
jgi:hypothetical protein